MEKKRVHFMGVGGAGCSAVFAFAQRSGFIVSGCDREKYSPYLDSKLSKFVSVGHSPDHLRDVDTLVYSPAIPIFDPENLEFQEAHKRGIRNLPWEQFLAEEFLSDKYVVAVTGTHGKGTITAMVGSILEKTGFDPTVLVGANVNSWRKNYRIGKSKYFVLEADEYKQKFLVYNPDLAVISNIDFDHPDAFKDPNELVNAFKKFTNNMKEGSLLIVGPGIDIENPKGRTAKIVNREKFNLKMPGEFNQMNATLAAAVGRSLTIPENKIKEALEGFTGIARRFEFVGEQKNVLVFDDYAHHPTALLETAKAVREKFPDKRIWLVFQPHLFSRTRALFELFVKAFEKAPVDKIVLVDIYAAREKSDGVSSGDLTKAVKNKDIKYIPQIEEAAVYLTKEAFAGDIVVSMGAGDIYRFPKILLRKLAGKG